jgi:sugar-specific transcriptional regulator TrmB
MTESDPDPDVDSDEAVDALERLGLSGYEARTFVALTRLGEGTANDIHQLSDVPQSRVYGVAERLQNRGLVELQESKPKRYRPVPLEEARALLRAELETAEEAAFDRLDRLQRSISDERGETVWMVRGQEAIANRVAKLIEEAERRVVFGADTPEQVPDVVAAALGARAASGVSVFAMGNAETSARYPESVATVDTSAGTPAPANGARILLVDDHTVLMSTTERDPTIDDGSIETAMWTAGTGLGRMLAGVLDNAMAGTLNSSAERDE